MLPAAMPDEPDPPRKFYQLKPTEFERVNPARPPVADPSAAPDPGPSGATPTERIDVRDLNRQAIGTAPLLGVNAPVNRANEVHAMLQGNLDAADAAGLNEVPFQPKRRSRRKRDYWLLLITGNAIFGFFALKGGSVVTLVYSGAGIIFFTLGLTWVMWFVMDDY